MIEKNNHLINKWSFMLKNLDSKYEQNFSKMFESTALHTNTNTIKIALPLLQKLLYLTPKIKFSSTLKNSLLLDTIERELIINGQAIMPDETSEFINHIAKLAASKFESGELIKINHLRIVDGPFMQVTIYY